MNGSFSFIYHSLKKMVVCANSKGYAKSSINANPHTTLNRRRGCIFSTQRDMDKNLHNDNYIFLFIMCFAFEMRNRLIFSLNVFVLLCCATLDRKINNQIN